jgi:hydroxyethylthiazole kinase-like uncharacterized protein yjeF
MALKTLEGKTIKQLLKPRAAASHKGDHGHALLISGDKGKMGASIISARACLRSGVGLLSVNIPDTERLIIQTAIPEAMVLIREKDKTNPNQFAAVGIGPGLGLSKASIKLAKNILTNCNRPQVWDADALTILAAEKTLLKKLKKESILTPHPKEFDRLFGTHKSEEQRRKKAVEMANKYKIIIVLKGSITMIAYQGETFLNTTGNSGLAKGGSGDALTGMITAFLAQGYTALTAAKIAVYLHGLAADLTLTHQSKESMLISDVIENLGMAFKKVMK